MENKDFVMKNKKKLIFTTLIVFLFSAILFGVFNNQFVTKTNASQEVQLNGGSIDEYSLDDIRSILNNGGQFFQDIRVLNDTTGAKTYQIPVDNNEIDEYLVNQSNQLSKSQNIPQSYATTNTTFPYTTIRDSGLSHENSIVIIIMGDAFTANQYGTWPNPASGTVLAHANNAISAMTSTHPFSLFSHLFTVYVVHAPSTTAGVSGCFGSVTSTGEFTSSGVRQALIRELAEEIVAPANIAMIQILSNAIAGTGVTFGGWYYNKPPVQNNTSTVRICITSIRRGSNPVGGSNSVFPDGTAFHGTFIHEFGHGFGCLIDEHDTGLRDEARGNSTKSADANVKWQHWLGHRNVATTPVRFSDGWAVPAGTNCLMRASWAHREFCGVCRAELIRRLALYSGETTLGRSPTTSTPLPITTIVTIPNGANRVLDSAFHGNTVIQTIVIPASASIIGDFAFLAATGLRNITNNAITPQQINNTTFAASGVTSGNPNQLNRALITVTLPVGTKQSYINAGWTGFNLVEDGWLTSTSGLPSGQIAITGVAGNKKLTGSVDIPSTLVVSGITYTVTQIGTNAFSGQDQMSQITIPANVTTIGSNAFLNTNGAAIYLVGRTSAPNTFNANWNPSNNPVYLNGNLCTHPTKTLTNISSSKHGQMCNTCRTTTNIVSHSYTHDHTWHNYKQHRSYCDCGANKLIGHAVSSSDPGMPYKTCLHCGGPAEVGFVQTGRLTPIGLTNFEITIEEYFGNGSYILSNGVLVLADADLESYLNGQLLVPDCEDCCDHCHDSIQLGYQESAHYGNYLNFAVDYNDRKRLDK